MSEKGKKKKKKKRKAGGELLSQNRRINSDLQLSIGTLLVLLLGKIGEMDKKNSDVPWIKPVRFALTLVTLAHGLMLLSDTVQLGKKRKARERADTCNTGSRTGLKH